MANETLPVPPFYTSDFERTAKEALGEEFGKTFTRYLYVIIDVNIINYTLVYFYRNSCSRIKLLPILTKLCIITLFCYSCMTGGAYFNTSWHFERCF